MASFIIYKKLTNQEAQKTWKELQKWFQINEDRDDCNTDLGEVRRKSMKADFLAFCEDGVKLVYDRKTKLKVHKHKSVGKTYRCRCGVLLK